MKKKLLAMCLTMVMVFSTTTIFAESKTSETYMLGDVNNDGDVTLSDAQKILRYALVIEQCKNEAVADVNRDGIISLSDAQKTLRVALAIDKFENPVITVPVESETPVTSEKPVESTAPIETLEPTMTPDNSEHEYVWTHVTENGANYKVMKCSDCGVETGEKAEYIGTDLNGKEIYGYFDEEKANILWGYINEQRTEHTEYTKRDFEGNLIGVFPVPALERTDELDQIAKDRVLTGALDSDDWTNCVSDNECIGYGSETPELAIDSWLLSYQCRIMIHHNYIKGGICCFMYDKNNNGEFYPVWILSVNRESQIKEPYIPKK